MVLSGVMALALVMSAGAGGERLLLCRPKVSGDPALARGDAILEAARKDGRFLDYGVVCEDAGEGARAARRMGLSHAVSTRAEGRAEASRFMLVLADAETGQRRGERSLEVAPGGDAVRPMRTALAQLADSLPRPPGPRPARIAAWSLVGAGAAALVAGAVVASQARSAATRANQAQDLVAHLEARDEWKRKRTASGVLLGAGGVVVAAGVTLRLAF